MLALKSLPMSNYAGDSEHQGSGSAIYEVCQLRIGCFFQYLLYHLHCAFSLSVALWEEGTANDVCKVVILCKVGKLL